LVVLFFDWRMPYVIQPARDVLYAAYNPIYALASYPVLSREWLNQQTKSETQLRRENTAMQAELLQAQVRLQKLSELSAENNRLRGLLDTPLIIDGRMQIAEVIGTDADPLRHIIIINRGSVDHLKVGQTVLDDKGIMGQLINVYPHSARIMLLSDKEHSLSVRLERTGMRAIVSGTGDLGHLKMEYVRRAPIFKRVIKYLVLVWVNIFLLVIWWVLFLRLAVILQVSLQKLMLFLRHSLPVVIMW
jgi:rod shape-determining protein MreC